MVIQPSQDAMPKTVRVSEEAYNQLHEIADEMGVPVRGVVDDYLASMGEIVGYCPEHGTPFTEEDIETRVFASDCVRCPEKYQSCRAEKRAHQDVTDGSEKIPVGELSEPPAAEKSTEEAENGAQDDEDDESE